MNVEDVVIGMKVTVSSPAYVNGTGFVSPKFFGQEVTVVKHSGVEQYPEAFAVDLGHGLWNIIDATFLTPVVEMTAEEMLREAGLL